MPWRADLQHAVPFERTAVTPFTFTSIFIPAFFSYYAMAVLVQLPHTTVYRAALLPVTFWLALRANLSLDFSSNYEGHAYLNQALALAMFTIAMRSTSWVFAARPCARLPICKLENGTTNGHNGSTRAKHGVSVPSALWNAWDLIVNLRGVGWNWSQSMHIPKPYFRVHSRLTFASLTFLRLTFFVFVFDLLNNYVRSFGPETFARPKGGTILDPSLPPTERYMKSFTVTALSGITAYVAIEISYQLHALLFTILFQQYPSQWPPLFDSPWMSTSLASFWGRRWHQLFRESFVVVGSRPAQRYLGRAGVVMGAFAVSGILHDVGMQGMGRGADTIPIVGFFLVQGVLVLVEHAWTRATGSRVGGVLGWLWTLTWLVLLGQSVVDVWARRGLLGSEFYPEAYRPITLLLRWMSR